MTFEEVLLQLGVRPDTLSVAEKRHLDEQGYLLLYNIITIAEAARMRAAMEELFAAEKTVSPAECGNMQNKSPVFDVCVTHPRVLAALLHVLRSPFKSLGVTARPSPPGAGQQAMHIDGDYGLPGEYYTCNSMWPLIDFTAKNGSTRVVPGSHRNGKKIEDEMPDLSSPHPREINLVAPVGTVIIFNGHLWHSSTLNRSDHPRASTTSFWCRRQMPPEIRPLLSCLTKGAAARLGAAAQCLFDLE